MTTLLLLILTVAGLLTLWFTDPVPHYAKLFRMEKFFRIAEWQELNRTIRPAPPTPGACKAPRPERVKPVPWVNWWASKRGPFVAKLASCPFCLAFWLSGIVCLISGHPAHMLAAAFGGLFLFRLLR